MQTSYILFGTVNNGKLGGAGNKTGGWGWKQDYLFLIHTALWVMADGVKEFTIFE